MDPCPDEAGVAIGGVLPVTFVCPPACDWMASLLTGPLSTDDRLLPPRDANPALAAPKMLLLLFLGTGSLCFVDSESCSEDPLVKFFKVVCVLGGSAGVDDV